MIALRSFVVYCLCEFFHDPQVGALVFDRDAYRMAAKQGALRTAVAEEATSTRVNRVAGLPGDIIMTKPTISVPKQQESWLVRPEWQNPEPERSIQAARWLKFRSCKATMAPPPVLDRPCRPSGHDPDIAELLTAGWRKMPLEVECDLAPSYLAPDDPASHPMVETRLCDPIEKCLGDSSTDHPWRSGPDPDKEECPGLAGLPEAPSNHSQ